MRSCLRSVECLRSRYTVSRDSVPWHCWSATTSPCPCHWRNCLALLGWAEPCGVYVGGQALAMIANFDEGLGRATRAWAYFTLTDDLQVRPTGQLLT